MARLRLDLLDFSAEVVQRRAHAVEEAIDLMLTLVRRKMPLLEQVNEFKDKRGEPVPVVGPDLGDGFVIAALGVAVLGGVVRGGADDDMKAVDDVGEGSDLGGDGAFPVDEGAGSALMLAVLRGCDHRVADGAEAVVRQDDRAQGMHRREAAQGAGGGFMIAAASRVHGALLQLVDVGLERDAAIREVGEDAFAARHLLRVDLRRVSREQSVDAVERGAGAGLVKTDKVIVKLVLQLIEGKMYALARPRPRLRAAGCGLLQGPVRDGARDRGDFGRP